MKIYVIAGEESGDSRGAELMSALKTRHPDWQFFGAGGRLMRAIGGEHIHDWTGEAVIGLLDVLKKYGYFRAQLHRMLAEAEELRPDAIVLIDYPGFNLRFAKAIRPRLPDTRIIQYVSPQVWAWNRGRIPKMAKFLDLMLCIFPFEQPLYEKSGLHAVFVGHPMVDSLAERRIAEPRNSDLVTLLPGSRRKEIRKIFPAMLAAARLLKERQPRLRFETSAASEALAQEMRGILQDAGVDESFCRISMRNSHVLMQTAAAGMVASGTATLEAAFFGLPMTIVYKVALFTWVVGKQLVKIPHLGMPNILAGSEIVREFLQFEARPGAIADEVERLMTPAGREKIEADLRDVIAMLGSSGAGSRAAEAICLALERKT